MSVKGAMQFDIQEWESYRIAPISFMETCFPTLYAQCRPLPRKPFENLRNLQPWVFLSDVLVSCPI